MCDGSWPSASQTRRSARADRGAIADAGIADEDAGAADEPRDILARGVAERAAELADPRWVAPRKAIEDMAEALKLLVAMHPVTGRRDEGFQLVHLGHSLRRSGGLRCAYGTYPGSYLPVLGEDVASSGVVILPGDKLTVPAQDRVRCHQARELVQHASAQDLTLAASPRRWSSLNRSFLLLSCSRRRLTQPAKSIGSCQWE